jgi:hypothetical protein
MQQRIKLQTSKDQLFILKETQSLWEIVLMEILYLFKSLGWAVDVTPQGIGSAYSGLNVIIKKIKQVTFKGLLKQVLLLEAGNITNYY